MPVIRSNARSANKRRSSFPSPFASRALSLVATRFNRCVWSVIVRPSSFLRDSGLLGLRSDRLYGRILFAQQSGHRLIDQRRPSLQIALDDQLAVGVFAEPPFAVTQEFVDFGVTDVIMLLLVEGGQQHIHVRKCIVNRHPGFECQTKIVALAPLRKRLVEWDRLYIDFVAPRFEKPSQDVCSAARSDDT